MPRRRIGLTASTYDRLPEDTCGAMEVVDGAIVPNPPPSRSHQRFTRRLANALDVGVGDRWVVATSVDLRLRDVPLLNRRPDVVVYDGALPHDDILRPRHCLLVVEIMSPGSVTTDQTDKPAEYASAGIPHFWRLESAPDDEERLTLFRYRLDPTTRTYASAGVDAGKAVISDPVDVTFDLADLI
ncbi:hypothetical protein [Alloactinosynnema sp. L-07]|uniref:Uma2 family endonuclease n=1 Tax=Alloactinosynnema sp. L-07 TaxID=1653480 RepID=UPI00065EFDAB|nr:Uma2 family endonuclease [Alloactinosynnema sp. L-07]CRK59652.1 hypothetical protein [Alloactinosynnema sp. L-07]